MKLSYLWLILCAVAPFHLAAQRSLDKQIGQMLLVGFRGVEAGPDSKIVRDLKKYHIGSVVLFDIDVSLRAAGEKNTERNIRSPEQLRRLTAQLKAAADGPLFIGIDQEGGRVNRLKPVYGFPPSISADSLGKIDHLDSTYQRAAVIARTLREAGINVNFAPDVDLDICPYPDSSIIHKSRRSFGKNPQRVAEHAAAFIRAHHEQGILTAIKHFPGHGSAMGDTHDGFTDVTKVWKPTELEPFRQVIASGQCDMVMTAHIFNAWLDPLHPATLSDEILEDILREEYHYEGLIISDDMQMGAITKNFGLERAIELAVNGGVDLLLFGNNLNYDPDIAEKAFTAFKKLVKEGKISKKRIKEANRRIKRLKKRFPTSF